MKQPKLDLIGDGVYRLTERFVYGWQHNGLNYRIIVPEGFETDIATVPRWVWTFSGIVPDGLHRAAAVLHDWMYMHKGKLPPGSYQVHRDGSFQDLQHTFSREECDRMFGRLMREAGVKPWKRKLMFWAVRTFGGAYWNKRK